MARNRSTIADMFGLRQDVDNIIQKDNTVNHWEFDKDIYKDIYQRSSTMKQSVKKGEQLLKPYPDLSEDIFFSLYKYRPQLMDEEEVTASHLFNRQLIEEMMQSEDYYRLRTNTRSDAITSALGSEIIHDQLIQKIEQARNEYLQKKAEAEANGQQAPEDFFQMVNDLHGLEQQINGLQGAIAKGPGKGKNGKAQHQQMQQQLQQAQQQAQQAQKQLQQHVQQNGNPMQNAIQQAMQSAQKEVQEASEFMDSWGMGSGAGDMTQRLSYEDKKQALRRLRASAKLKKFAKLIGRFRKLAIQEQKRKTPEGSQMVKDVIIGNDLAKVLPSEFLLMGHPIAKKLFLQKYVENNLLMYDKDAYDNVGKGPIVVCLDTSGSMGGEKEQWSKALALALLEVAQKQRRHYACLHFHTSVPYKWEIPAGQLKPQDVFDIAEKFSGGGTAFDPPLEEALKIIEKDKFRKADIVFITDGESSVSDRLLERFNKVKKEKQFKVRSVLININGGASPEYVRPFSDDILDIRSMANLDDASASNIFAQV